MASTFTTSLGLEIQATGENRSSWGTKTNTNLSLVEEAISTLKIITMTDANMTLTKVNAGTDQSRPMFLRFTGTLTADRTITVPTVSKLYFMQNNTAGGKNLKITAGGVSFYMLAPGERDGTEQKSGQWKMFLTNGTTIWTSDDLFSASSATRRWDIVGQVSAVGDMEVGKAIDFHNTNADATDWAVRLETGLSTTDLYVTAAGGSGKKIWHAGNDGAASGLDADLLDGLHANQIYTDAPADGKQYLRKNGAWVAVDTPWSIDPANSEILLKFGAATVIRIKASGLILTEDDIEVFSTSVGV